MSTVKLNPFGADFDRFLYAEVGADPQGGLLSVVSALARLGVDPWEQAAILARLPVDSAARALCALLARLPAGAGAPLDSMPLANHLVSLLPRHPHRTETAPAFAVPHGSIRRIPSRWLRALLFVVFILLVLGAQRLMER